MIGSEVLIALTAILATAVGVVGTCVALMVWLVKRSDKRQDSTISNNTTALKQNNDAYIALAKSISDSTVVSRSLEGSIRKRDEQDSAFQAHVLDGFKSQNKLIKTVSVKSDRILTALKVPGDAE